MKRFVVVTAVIATAAMLLARPSQAESWDRNAVYAAREAALKAAVAQKPKDPQPLVALAAFYLKPLAPRDVAAADGQVRRVMVPLRNEWTGPIKDIYAVPWVFRGDTALAFPLLKQALALNPKYAPAMREMALMYRMRNDLDRMRPYMEAALRANPLDLDMCRLYLDHRTALARVLNDQAGGLRTPRIWEEDRPNGRRVRITQQPSQADTQQAARFDAQAQDVRRDAIKPLHSMMKTFKEDPRTQTDAAQKSQWHFGTAIYFAWRGELEKSAGTTRLALRIDPTNLDALDFLVDTLRLTHTKDKLATYKAILDRWTGADSTPIIIRSSKSRPKG